MDVFLCWLISMLDNFVIQVKVVESGPIAKITMSNDWKCLQIMYIEQNSITNTIYNLLYHDQFAMSGSGEREM